MGMNMRPEGGRTPYFTDRKVRKALAHCVPVDEIIQVIAKGYATRIPCFILPSQSDFDKNLPLIPYDLQRSRSLLDDAGWMDTDGDNVRDKLINGHRVPFSFALSYMVSPVTKEIALMIRNELYKVGVDARLDPMDFSLFYQNAYNHQFDAILGAWSSSALPEDPRQIWHTENWENKGSNFVGFGNAQSDRLIEEANLEMNPEKRKIIMQNLQKLVWEEQPYVFLFNATKKVALHRRFAHGDLFSERPHVLLNYLQLLPAGVQSTPDQP
jgi:ABC-type transport system substrate-binding protein